METCQGPKSRQIGGGSCADEGTRVDCRLGSAPRIHAHGIGAYDAQGGDGEQCVAPAARLRGDVARSEIGTPRSADPAAGVRRLRLRCALLRNRQGRVHALSRPHALSCRDRSRILWRDRGCGKGSPGSAARRHGHLRGDDLVRRMHALPQWVPQPVRAVGGDRFHHQRRAGRPDRRRCQVLLEDQCPGGSLRQRGVGV